MASGAYESHEKYDFLKYDDGTFLSNVTQRIPFENAVYDPEANTFTGTLDFTNGGTTSRYGV